MHKISISLTQLEIDKFYISLIESLFRETYPVNTNLYNGAIIKAVNSMKEHVSIDVLDQAELFQSILDELD